MKLLLFILRSTNNDRFQPPRRMDNVGVPSRYRSFRPLEDEDSSDTDTGISVIFTSKSVLIYVLYF